MSTSAKLGGGRFQKPTHELVDQLNASLPFDQRLARHDILGSLAHVTMLARQGIVPLEDARAIAQGLRTILREIEEQRFTFRLADEDIHLSVERRLRELIGPVAGRLHTARSRNDQVALDFRLWLRNTILDIAGGIVETAQALLAVAEAHRDVVMPGYTHLQRAQPVLLAHHLHAYVTMLGRDLARLRELYGRVNRSPLGSGALAGVPYPIDRQFVADLLAMDGILENSIDAVSDRDFALEFLAALAILMAHLSRLAEELVLWSTSEFGFIEFDDAFATGSSIMPQKKNPDVAELLRGKSGRVFGHLIGLLTVVKGLPLAYNKDLQEDKEGVFDAADTVTLLLRVVPPMLRTMRIDRERMAAAAEAGFTLATDVADALVRAGVPFREAHEAVGRLVAYCIANRKTFAELRHEELAQFHPQLATVDLPRTAWDAVRAREHPGGTGPEQVARALATSRSQLAEASEWTVAQRRRIEQAFARLLSEDLP
ncbi:MAG: argininosuccinate lyase [Thermomicrobium sp.]|nr:argininosuccinate lyase [Thermomicrobium sp.]MDW8005452.1 argininosuccinate lyase [Thermomicrobium sp.]